MAENRNQLDILPELLLPWFAQNKRQLPWRQDKEPYHIWVSEIMLQQTRVEAVKGYYDRFLKSIPSVESLANAPDNLLYKLWEGLGYYSRVRNMKKAAQVITEQHGGVFPSTYAQVLALPGVGPYTAGAICSIAFDLKTPAVDGNVLRLYSRLTNDPTPIDLPEMKKRTTRELGQIYPAQAGDFTQALMELGATVCGPNREPDCPACPLKSICRGYEKGTAKDLPARLPKKDKKHQQLTVFILSCDGKYALDMRNSDGLLAGMWQLPNTPGHLSQTQALSWLEDRGLSPQDILRKTEKTHIFTHIKWDMLGYYISVRETDQAFTWLSAQQISREAALPTAFRQFL